MYTSNYSYTLAPLRLLAIEQGVDFASCLALAGLSREDFDRQEGLIAVAQYTAFAPQNDPDFIKFPSDVATSTGTVNAMTFPFGGGRNTIPGSRQKNVCRVASQV